MFFRVFPCILLSLASVLTVAGQERATGKEKPSTPLKDPWGRADTIPLPHAPEVSPAPAEEMLASFRKGVDFLLQNQHENGSWGDRNEGREDWSVWCPYSMGPRAFRTASTALCIIGLESSPMNEEQKVQEAVIRAEDYLLGEMPKLKRSDAGCLYSTWAHAYVLEAFSIRAAKLHKQSARYKQLKECAGEQIKALNLSRAPQGGWGYLVLDERWTVRPNTESMGFITATVFIAAKMAEETFGLKLDDKSINRSMTFLKSQRTPAGTYLYSESHRAHPAHPINRHTGSLARTPACDLAIKLYEPEAISTRQLLDGLERLWSRSGWLEMSLKKPMPHESFAANSGYFYYYGYYYVGRCLSLVPKEVLRRHASHLVSDILPRQETDGSWWDYPLYNYHKFYGTGYAMSAMGKAWDALYREEQKEQQ